MGLIVIDAKHRNKRSTVPGVVPEIGVSEDHTDGSWAANMIYPGELFVNIPDQRVWIGIEGDVLEIFSAATVYPSLAFADQPITPGIETRMITLGGNDAENALAIQSLAAAEVARFCAEGSIFSMLARFNATTEHLGSLNRFSQQFEVSSNGALANDVIRITDAGGIVYGRNDRYNKAGFHTYFLGGNTSGDVRRFAKANGTALHDWMGDGSQRVYGSSRFDGDVIGGTNVTGNSGSGYVTIGQRIGTPTEGALYSIDAVPSASNFRFLFTTAATYANAGTSFIISTGNTDRVTTNATGTFTRSAHTLAVGKGSLAHSTLEVNGSAAYALRSVAAATSLGINDNGLKCSGTFNVTLPSAVGVNGREYVIINEGTGVISVLEAGGQKISGDSIWYLPFQGSAVTVVSDGSQWWVKNAKQRNSLNVVVSVAGGTYQNNELIGARSISLIIRGGAINQGPFTFNSTTGTITTAVAVSDKLSIFYVPQ